MHKFKSSTLLTVIALLTSSASVQCEDYLTGTGDAGDLASQAFTTADSGLSGIEASDFGTSFSDLGSATSLGNLQSVDAGILEKSLPFQQLPVYSTFQQVPFVSSVQQVQQVPVVSSVQQVPVLSTLQQQPFVGSPGIGGLAGGGGAALGGLAGAGFGGGFKRYRVTYNVRARGFGGGLGGGLGLKGLGGLGGIGGLGGFGGGRYKVHYSKSVGGGFLGGGGAIGGGGLLGGAGKVEYLR